MQTVASFFLNYLIFVYTQQWAVYIVFFYRLMLEECAMKVRKLRSYLLIVFVCALPTILGFVPPQLCVWVQYGCVYVAYDDNGDGYGALSMDCGDGAYYIGHGAMGDCPV